MKILLILNFIIPFVMVLIGYLLKKNPKTTVGSNGYSTPSARKSQERWDYAQSVAPAYFIVFGKVLFVVILLINTLLFLLPIDINKAVMIGNVIGFIALGICFYVVENKISIRFDKQ